MEAKDGFVRTLTQSNPKGWEITKAFGRRNSAGKLEKVYVFYRRGREISFIAPNRDEAYERLDRFLVTEEFLKEHYS